LSSNGLHTNGYSLARKICFDVAGLTVHDPLPGVGQTINQTLLDELNLRTIGMLAAVPVNKLMLIMGRQALLLHQQALGIDHSPVLPPERRLEIKEEYTFDEDSNDDQLIRGVLYYLLENGCRRLRQRRKQSRALRIFCRYADSSVTSRTIRLPDPLQQEYVMFFHIQQVFNQIFDRRTRLRYLSIGFEKLIQAADQTSLFSLSVNPQVDRHRALHQAMDKLRERHGYPIIRFGLTAPVQVKTAVPAGTDRRLLQV